VEWNGMEWGHLVRRMRRKKGMLLLQVTVVIFLACTIRSCSCRTRRYNIQYGTGTSNRLYLLVAESFADLAEYVVAVAVFIQFGKLKTKLKCNGGALTNFSLMFLEEL